MLSVTEKRLPPSGRVRWRVCALLFFSTTINYMDRQILALLKPVLQDPQRGIRLTEFQYACIVTMFSIAYAIGLLVAGRVIDRLGTKRGYALFFCAWAAAAASHSVVKVPAISAAMHHGMLAAGNLLTQISTKHFGKLGAEMGVVSGVTVGFGVARFLLGLGEAGNFPAAIKAVSEWFPKRERAFATGIFNSGCNIGATIAPFLVAFVVFRFGWTYAFLATTGFSLIWLALWLKSYQAPADDPSVSREELAYIRSDDTSAGLSGQPEAADKVRWSKLFLFRQTWAFLLTKVITDPIWWFYLYWLPGYLHAKFGLSLGKMGLPLMVIYNVSTIGSIGGGWIPSFLMRRGWSVNRARKSAMLLYAVLVLPMLMLARVRSLGQAIAIISLATAAHQAWSANLFTTVSDMFPQRAVATVVGIGVSGGSIAMTFFGLFVGYVLEVTHGSYSAIFVVAGLSYLLGLAVLHALAPRLAAAPMSHG